MTRNFKHNFTFYVHVFSESDRENPFQNPRTDYAYTNRAEALRDITDPRFRRLTDKALYHFTVVCENGVIRTENWEDEADREWVEMQEEERRAEEDERQLRSDYYASIL